MAYRNLFRPLGVSRVDFQRLYSYTRGIQTIKPKDIYAMEDQTVVDRLSLLLSGRVSVVRGGVTRHIVDCYQFLESPEWFGMNSSDKYQVSIVALEESQLLVWNRDKLKLSISSDRYLQIILDHILGRDIVKKLMLSLDIDSANMSSEKTKLIQTNFPMDQIISLNTIQGNPLPNTRFLLTIFFTQIIIRTAFGIYLRIPSRWTHMKLPYNECSQVNPDSQQAFILLKLKITRTLPSLI